MHDQKRRTVLKATLVGGMLTGIPGAGLLMPGRLLAESQTDPFMASTMQDALDALFKSADGSPVSLADADTNKISFTGTKDKPANSSSAPITVTSDVPDTKHISIFIEKNPRPLLAHFRLEPNAIPSIHIRAKMKETSRVIAVIEDASGKIHSSAMKITVTESGCAS